MLRENGELHRLADPHLTRRRFERAADNVKERGLAGPVLAEDPETVTRPDVPRDVVDDSRVAEALRHVVQLDDLLAQARDGRAFELEGIAHGRLVGNERVRLGDAELGLSCACLRTPRQPRELLAHEVATLLLGDSGRFCAFDALQHVRRVAALEPLDCPVVNLPCGEADLVEEPAVVRDHEQRARLLGPAGLEVIGQPGDGVYVEVVGRFVEHENVVVAHEHAREIDASSLPA